MKNKPKKDQLNPEHLASIELLSRYMIQETSPEEDAQIEKLLTTDPELYKLFRMAVEDELPLLPEAEAELVDEAGIAELHGKILGRIRPTPPPAPPRFRRYIASAAAAMLTLLSVYQGVIYWNVNLRIAEVQQNQENRFVLHYQSPQLSGNYDLKGLMMRGQDSTGNEQELQKAILFRPNDDDTRAYVRLMHEYIFTNNIEKLRNAISRLDSLPDKSGQLLNDLGCGFAQLGEHDTARQYFKEASEKPDVDNRCFYNLALMHIKLEQFAEARLELEKYLTMENKLGWHNAAKKLLQTLPDSL